MSDKGQVADDAGYAHTLSNSGPYVAINANSQTYYLHRLVAKAFIGPPAPGEIVRHLDDDKSNNQLANLAYGSYADNAADRKLNGIRSGASGNEHSNAKLNASTVKQIRALGRYGFTHRQIAAWYDVAHKTIWQVIHRKKWNHIE